MPNLLDTIRQNSGQLPEQGVTDETQKLQGLLRAKSGKAVGGSAVSASNLGEQQAVAQTGQTLQNQIQPQAQIQAAQQGQQQAATQQAEQIQRTDIAQQRRFNDVQNRMRTESLLNDMERQNKQLSLEKDRASLEQVASGLRLQDKQYIDNLQREGAKQRLDNQMEFNKTLTDQIMGDNQDLLQKRLNNKSVLDASDRDFNKAMANMDINTAWDIFNNDMAAQKQRAIYGAAGALTTAGIGAYGTYSTSKANAPKSTEEG